MRRFALLILLSVLPAFAAVETTTVNGKVVLSDGSAATAGSITCTLSAPGTALDGSTSQRVAGSDTATIGSDGTITGLTLVPNDAITPTGTTYKCAFNVSSPRRVSWDETWSVATSPDPVNVGSITRYNVAPGITAGSFLLYVTSEPSGSCTSGEAPRQSTATGKTCACSAGTWSCIGGGATPAGSSTELQYRNGSSLGAAPIILDSDGTKQDRLVSTADLVGPHGQPVGGDTGGTYFLAGRRRATSAMLAANSRTTSPVTAPVSVPIAIIGDSVAALMSQSIPDQWARRGGLGGLGFDPIADSDIYAGSFTRRTKTFGGGWVVRHPGGTAPTNQLEWGVSGSSVTANSDDDTLTYSVGVACNRVTVFYARQPGGGTFQWSTNGSSWTDVSTDGTAALGYVTSGGDPIGIYYGATAEVGNTLYLRYKTGSTGNVTLYGIYSYTRYVAQQPDRDTVVPVWLTAGGIPLAGARTYDAAADGDGTGSDCVGFGGTTINNGWANWGTSNVYLDAFLDLLQPSQIVIALGANDGCIGGTATCCVQGSTPAQFATDLDAVLDALEGYTTIDPDIVLVPAWERGTATGTWAFTTYNARAAGYRKAMYAEARARGLSVADVAAWWPPFLTAYAAGLMGDGVHPSSKGRAVLASWYSDWLLDPAWSNNERAVDVYCGQKALAAGALTAAACNYVEVYSTGAALTSITPGGRENKGRRLTIACTSSANWTIASGQSGADAPVVNTSFACAAGRSITFVGNGVNWTEVSRAGESTAASSITACQTFGSLNAGANGTTYLSPAQPSTSDLLYLPIPATATLKSVSCINNAALTAGTATLTVLSDAAGTATDLSVAYSNADASLTAKTDNACSSNCTPTSKVLVRVVTDASYAPTTIDWACNVCYTMAAW